MPKARRRRPALSLLLVLAATAPFGLVAVGARWLGDTAAVRAARGLHAAASGLSLLAPTACGQGRWTAAMTGGPACIAHTGLLLERERFVASGSAAEEWTTVGARPPAPAAPAQPALPPGLLIRAAQVRAAARRGARPSGASVPRTAYRPAGVALYGVSALGVGLHDGDVVTRVGGRAAVSPEAIVSEATAAVQAAAPAITGDVWRGPHRMVVTVEIPKRRKRPSAAERDAEPKLAVLRGAR